MLNEDVKVSTGNDVALANSSFFIIIAETVGRGIVGQKQISMPTTRTYS